MLRLRTAVIKFLGRQRDLLSRSKLSQPTYCILDGLPNTDFFCLVFVSWLSFISDAAVLLECLTHVNSHEISLQEPPILAQTSLFI